MWLEQRGVQVPRTTDGNPGCTLEISRLAAMDADQLPESLTSLPTINPGDEWYLEYQ